MFFTIKSSLILKLECIKNVAVALLFWYGVVIFQHGRVDDVVNHRFYTIPGLHLRQQARRYFFYSCFR